MCRRAWEATREDTLTSLVGIEPMTWWYAAVVVTTAPHPHTHSPSPYFHNIHTHTHTHTRTHAHTHFYSPTHIQMTLCTLSTHARKTPLGATHTEELMVCGVEGDARPNSQCICVCARRVQGNCPCTRSQIMSLSLKMRVKEAKRGEDDLTIVFPVKNYAY